MVDVLLWLYVIVMVALIGLFLIGLKGGRPTTDQMTQRVVLSLYAIRRRLEVAQFKTELRRDAADLRRELRTELNERERGRS